MRVGPIEWVGYAATLASIVQFTPQVARTLRSRDTTGLSPAMWTLLATQTLGWTAYAARSGLVPAIITNAVLGTCALIMLRLLVVTGTPRIRPAIGLGVVLAWIEVGVFLFLPNAVLGAVAATLAFIVLWPQVLVALRASDLSGLSAPTWAVSIGNCLLWVVYGIGRHVPVLWLSAGQAAVLSILVLARIVVVQRRVVVPAILSSAGPREPLESAPVALTP